MEASQLVHPSPDLSLSKPPLRKRKYDRRCTIKGPGNLRRMVSSSSNGSTDLQRSGHSTHRPVCIPSQQPVTNLLFLPCQSSGLGNRRIEHQLEGDPGLYISSNLSAPPCPGEDRSSDMQDAIKMFFRTAGLTDTAAALAAKSRRASTRKTYDNRLQYYIKWYFQKAVNPYSASRTDIGDFFVRLFDSRLQIATI